MYEGGGMDHDGAKRLDESRMGLEVVCSVFSVKLQKRL